MHHLRRIFLNTVSRRSRRVYLQCRNRSSSTLEVPPTERVSELYEPKFRIPKGIMGQPTCYSHPHLVQKGQLTYGITQAEYVNRRDNLITKLANEVQRENMKHVVIIPGAVKQYMSDKIPYVFRQNSDFYYLTGCMEPSAILVMVKPAEKNEYQSMLFVNEKDEHAEQWEGPRTGCKSAAQLFAVNESLPVHLFPNYITQITNMSPSVLWYHIENSANPELNPTVQANTMKKSNVIWADPQSAIHSLRVIKSPAEIELMKDTCFIGSEAINMAMACTQPGISEHSLSSVLEFTCRQAGAEHLAFPPVVAGGPRATHIHYINNNQLLKGDELVLVDSGSQRWLYTSDISRTWPVNGRFSKYQKILYELVLAVQKRLIYLLGEQRQPLDKLFDQMCRLLGTHLQAEGILPRNLDNLELMTRAYKLCPHHVSHYLGLDVHDSSLIRRNVPVVTNMIVTVEPGLYISPNDMTVPAEFRGMGIRIEDDVLITDGAPKVLTEHCVKEVQDIEALVGKKTL